MKSIICTLLIASSFSLNVYAEDKEKDHTKHHPAETAAVKSNNEMNNGMMGKMDMNRMMEMMNQCQSMHKDSKMCDHDIMQSCQKSMDSKECSSMMKEMKKKIK